MANRRRSASSDRRSRAILGKLCASAGKQRRGVRIRLHLDETPELASLPWEYLYDPAADQCIAVTSPIVLQLPMWRGTQVDLSLDRRREDASVRGVATAHQEPHHRPPRSEER